MKNGVYSSRTAYYYVYQDKVMMVLNGSHYKTTTNFMVGASFVKPLTEGQMQNFDKAYEKCKEW